MSDEQDAEPMPMRACAATVMRGGAVQWPCGRALVITTRSRESLIACVYDVERYHAIVVHQYEPCETRHGER